VVPNGAGEDLMKVWGKREPEPRPTIFFQANFSWLQNVEAAWHLAKDVFPAVKKEIKNAHCWIVGQSAKEKIGELSSDDVVVIDLGNVDTRGVIEAYKKATVFVAPLEGPGGTRLKILGAMAAGVPVVSSKIGIEGIDVKEDKEVMVAPSWEQMAEKTLLLINDKKLYQKVAASARKLIEEKYSYEHIAEILNRIYLEVAGGKS